jgi:hypothetical protein
MRYEVNLDQLPHYVRLIGGEKTPAFVSAEDLRNTAIGDQDIVTTDFIVTPLDKKASAIYTTASSPKNSFRLSLPNLWRFKY